MEKENNVKYTREVNGETQTKYLPASYKYRAALEAAGWKVAGDVGADLRAQLAAANAAAAGASIPEEKPLGKMNKTELMAKAAELKVEVPEGATNAQIVELIEAGTVTE